MERKLIEECIERCKAHLDVSLVGDYVYTNYGKPNAVLEFNIEGYNFAYNLARLGKLVYEKGDFR